MFKRCCSVSQKCTQISCGVYYTAALSEDGAVFTWGEGSEGQLGHGFLEDFEVGYVDEYIQRTMFTYLSSPRKVEGVAGTRIKYVACGGNHTSVITEDFRVFEWGSWGHRTDMELDGDTKKEFSPVEMVGAPALRSVQYESCYMDPVYQSHRNSSSSTTQVQFNVTRAGAQSRIWGQHSV
jgi:hypothetical protein